jgi:formylmethanofuran dehydrogenase subunit D
MRMEVTLITGRTIHQGIAIESGKDADRYREAAGICELDPEDLDALDVAEGETVKVTTDAGSIHVTAVKSTQAPHKGIAFIPMGPWANFITSPKTHSTGMPSFKGVPARVEPAREERVLNAPELMRSLYARELAEKAGR